MHLTLIATLTAMLAVAASRPLTDDEVDKGFEEFKSKHGRKYQGAEHTRRRGIYKDNVNRINKHNDEKHSYQQGVNEFSDMTPEEFADKMLMKNIDTGDVGAMPQAAPTVHRQKRQTTLPDTVDYRTTGCIAPIKNQGVCGSCWAFGAVSALEYYNCMKTSQLTLMSEQNLIDCTLNPTYGNLGCKGGHVWNAWRYVKDQGGIDTSASYPYTANNGTCHYSPDSAGGASTGYVHASWLGNETALKQAVGSAGVVTVYVDASRPTFQFYKSGIYNDTTCRQTYTHVMTVVGYGTENGIDYWLVRNSWGTSWGLSGYVKMIRNYNNQCYIASYGYYPTV